MLTTWADIFKTGAEPRFRHVRSSAAESAPSGPFAGWSRPDVGSGRARFSLPSGLGAALIALSLLSPVPAKAQQVPTVKFAVSKTVVAEPATNRPAKILLTLPEPWKGPNTINLWVYHTFQFSGNMPLDSILDRYIAPGATTTNRFGFPNTHVGLHAVRLLQDGLPLDGVELTYRVAEPSYATIAVLPRQQGSGLNIEASPACDGPVPDLSVNAQITLSLPSPPAADVATEYRMVFAGAPPRFSSWQNSIMTIEARNGRSITRVDDVTLARRRSSTPGFVGYEYRRADNHNVTGRCVWQFKNPAPCPDASVLVSNIGQGQQRTTAGFSPARTYLQGFQAGNACPVPLKGVDFVLHNRSGGPLTAAQRSSLRAEVWLGQLGGGGEAMSELDPVSWTPDPCRRRYPRCRDQDRRTQQSSVARWWIWSGPGAARTI